MYSWFLTVIITSTPFYFRAGNYIPLEYCREQFFLFSAIFGILVFRNRSSIKFTGPILALLAMAYFNQYHVMATAMLLQYLPFVAGLLILNQTLHNTLNIELLLRGMRVSSIVECFWLLLNHFGIEPLQWIFPEIYFQTSLQNVSKTVPIMGSLENPVPSALLIAILFPLFLQGKWRYFLPLGILSLYLSGSASAFLAFFVAVGLWFYVKYCSGIHQESMKHVKRVAVSVIGSAILFIYLYKTGFFYASERLTKWPMILKFNNAPFFGKGLGYFRDNFPAYSGGVESWMHAHNILLDLYCAFGFAGLILVGYLLKQADFRKNLEISCCFIGLMVGGMFYSAFHQVPLALIGIVLFSTMANKEAL